MKLDSKSKILLVALAAVFLAFNAVFFLIASVMSLDIMSASTIISWVFMAIGFVSFLVFTKMSTNDSGLQNVMFLGFTIVKHCIVYLIVDFALCVLTLIISAFTVLNWIWVLLIQAIVLLVHIIFVLLCIASKKTIENVGAKIAQKTSYMKLLKADAESLPDYCQDSEARAEFAAFAEAVKYSDPVSCEALESLEQRLSELVSKMKEELGDNNVETAKADCAKATLLLKERNTKCKVLKKHG